MVVLFFNLSVTQLLSQEEESFLRTDTLGKKKIQVIALPIIFFTPETSFGFGAGTQLFFLSQSNIYNSRLSNIFIDAIYTTENQLIIDAKPQLFFEKGDYYLDGAFKYKVFPNSFWGIGNNTPEINEERYNMRTILIKAAFLKRLPPNLNFGFEYKWEDNKMLEVEEGGQLDSTAIAGSEGSRFSGLAFIFNLDNRDNIYSPQKGNFLQLQAGFSSQVFGASHSFNEYVIDLRKYFGFGKKSILAAQLYFDNNFGDLPFQSMAWFGGGQRGRGYFNGRFIDLHMYVAQVEYRLRFLPRWAVNAFFSTGEVADLPGNYFRDPKRSFGGGIRFQIKKDNPTLLRLDIGIGEDGNTGVYFGVNEAF